MLKQNTRQTLKRVSVALALSLCSLNAFSSDKFIEFTQGVGLDSTTYLVETMKDPAAKCMEEAPPVSFETSPGVVKKLQMKYLKTIKACGIFDSGQMFRVSSKENLGIFALLWWIKAPGATPKVLKNEESDPHNLLTVDNSDGDNIKVTIGHTDKVEL